MSTPDKTPDVDPALVRVCHEDVTRAGISEPCEKPAVAMRIDVRDGRPYPVCAKHTRKPMVQLPDVLAAARVEQEAELRELRFKEVGSLARDQAFIVEIERGDKLKAEADAARAEVAAVRAVVAEEIAQALTKGLTCGCGDTRCGVWNDTAARAVEIARSLATVPAAEAVES